MVGSFAHSITYSIKGISHKQIRNGHSVSVLNLIPHIETSSVAFTRYFQKQKRVPGDNLCSDCDMALVCGTMRGRSLPHNKCVIFLEISMTELQGKSVEVFLHQHLCKSFHCT